MKRHEIIKVMSPTREKFATQVNSEILTAVRSLPHSEGRQLQALVDEAFTASHEKYGQLLQKAR